MSTDNTERDQLARDIFVAGANVMRWTPSEAYSWADAFLEEREKQRPAKESGAIVDARIDTCTGDESCQLHSGDDHGDLARAIRDEALALGPTPCAACTLWDHNQCVPGCSCSCPGEKDASTESAHDFDPLTCPPIAGDFNGPHGPLPIKAGPRAPVTLCLVVGCGLPGKGMVAHGAAWCLAHAVSLADAEKLSIERAWVKEYGQTPPIAGEQWTEKELADEVANNPPTEKPKAPRRRHWCCAPSCSAPGKTAKNASGAKVAKGGYLCGEHMRFAETDPALVRTWVGSKAQTVGASVAAELKLDPPEVADAR